MEEASPVLLIPWGWRAIAPSRWLHEFLSLTLGWCCHPILGGSLGASAAAAPLSLGAGSFCIVKQPWSSSLLGSSGLPHPSQLWGAPWALEEGAWWGPGWDMPGAEATGRTILNFLRNLQFVVISPLPAWATLLGWELNNPQEGLGNKCCSPDAQGILEQGFKSTFKGAKRLPEVMLSPGCRR